MRRASPCLFSVSPACGARASLTFQPPPFSNRFTQYRTSARYEANRSSSQACTSRSIGQPLADCPCNRAVSALGIVHAASDAVAVPEIKFRKVAVKVLFLTVLVNRLHTLLEDAEIAFDGVGVRIAANVFLF